jgi:hypothetical protein
LSAFALKVLGPLDLTDIAKYLLQRTLGQYLYHDDQGAHQNHPAHLDQNGLLYVKQHHEGLLVQHYFLLCSLLMKSNVDLNLKRKACIKGICEGLVLSRLWGASWEHVVVGGKKRAVVDAPGSCDLGATQGPTQNLISEIH